MDLNSLNTKVAAEEGAKLSLVHPATGEVLTDEKTGKALTITLAGVDSDRYREADRRITDKRLATTQAGRKVSLTHKSLESDQLERLVAATISWDGVGLGAETLECTPDNVRKIYKELLWIREQVEAFVNDRANFLRAPSLN